MSVVSWADARTRGMTVWDLGLVKLSSLLFGMIAGAYVAPFVREHVWWFIMAMVVAGLWHGFRWLTGYGAGTA